MMLKRIQPDLHVFTKLTNEVSKTVQFSRAVCLAGNQKKPQFFELASRVNGTNGIQAALVAIARQGLVKRVVECLYIQHDAIRYG